MMRGRLESRQGPRSDNRPAFGGMAKQSRSLVGLALDPTFLLFSDEPTTGLDCEIAEEIQDLIQVRCQSSSGFTERVFSSLHNKGILTACSPASSWCSMELLSTERPAFQKRCRRYLELMPSLHRQLQQQWFGPTSSRSRRDSTHDAFREIGNDGGRCTIS